MKRYICLFLFFLLIVRGVCAFASSTQENITSTYENNKQVSILTSSLQSQEYTSDTNSLSTSISLTQEDITKVTSTSPNQVYITNKKILIVYYSWSGNTKYIAEKIHARVGGTLIPIELVTPYPTDYYSVVELTRTQQEQGIHPQIQAIDTKSYDIIFIGSPIWWYTIAPPVITFLTQNDYKGKIIVPFVSHGGGGEYNIKEDIQKLTPTARVLTPLSVYYNGGMYYSLDREVDSWLTEIEKEIR